MSDLVDLSALAGDSPGTPGDLSVVHTMLIQIALLAWLFLGEALGPRAVVGLILAAGGILIVQLRRA